MIVRTSRHRRHNRCAFTLCELVIVLLFISVMAAAALPKWSGYLNQRRIAATAQRIAVDLQRTQAAAYSTSTAMSMAFDVAANQYTIAGLSPLNTSSGSTVVRLADDPYACQLVSVFGQTGSKTVTFNGFGEITAGGSIVIARGGLQKTIVVDAATGKAVVQ